MKFDIGVDENAFMFDNVATDDPRRYSDSNVRHRINAEAPTDVTFGKLAVVRLEQEANALFPMDVALEKLAVVRLKQPANAQPFIFVAIGKLAVVRCEQ